MNFLNIMLASVPSAMDIVESVLLMLAGTGVFLIGINMMGDRKSVV